VGDVTVEVGGVRAAIQTRHPEVADVVARRYAGFLSPEPAHWRIEAGLRPEGLVALEDVVVRAAGAPGRLTLERHDFVATLDVPARSGTLALGAVDDVALDTFLRVVYSVALLEAGALLVHAASLGRDARSWMFPGPSGSGKTTLTRLSPDATLLSDEISIVRLGADGGACCYGSPFWGERGEAGRNAAVPLRAIHFLRHAERHATTPLTPRRALAALLANVLFFAAEPALVARVLAVAAGVVERVPCFALGFRPEASVWEAIDGA
jgi:hypothetical protein